MNAHMQGASFKPSRFFAAFLFVAIGSLIMIAFSPWRPLLDDRADYLGRFGLVIMLAAAQFFARKSPAARPFAPVLTGLLILSTAVSFDYLFGVYLIKILGVSDHTPAEWAVQKFNEFIVLTGTVVFLNWAFRGSLADLYIQRGRLNRGLTTGLIAFALAAAFSIPMAQLFNAQDLSMARVLPWTPWVLVFVLCNGALEEIMFRGLFLKKLQPFVGRFGANLLVAVVFSLIHGAVTYSADNYLFVAITFFLALAWGDLIQRNDNVWGSILFHAGMDIPIALGIFSNLG